MPITNPNVHDDIDKIESLSQLLHTTQVEYLILLRELALLNPTLASNYMSCANSLDNLQSMDPTMITRLLSQPKNYIMLTAQISNMAMQQFHKAKKVRDDDIMNLVAEYITR